MFNNQQQLAGFRPGPHIATPDSLVISKVLFAQTRQHGYLDQISRPYSFNLTPEYIDNIARTVIPTGNKLHSVNEFDLHNACGGMLSYHTGMGMRANIEHGWKQNRLLFLLTANYTIGHMEYVTYIQGYTDHGEISYAGTLDPNMVMHINSICTVTKNLDPVSNTYVVNNIEYYNIVKNVAGETIWETNPLLSQGQDVNIKKCIRPIDIINNLFLLEDNKSMGGVTCEYTGNLYPQDTLSSNKINNNPLQYLTTTINSLVSAERYSGLGMASVPNILRTASGIVDDASYSRNALLLFIYNLTQDQSEMTSFRYGVIQPYLATAPIVVSNNDALLSKGTIGDAEDVESNMAVTAESIKSYAVAMQMSSILSNNMVTKIVCSISSLSGIPTILYLQVDSYIEGINPVALDIKIRNEIMLHVLPMLTDNGYTMVQCHIDGDLFNDITIAISIGNNPEVLHRYPLFADSLITPVLGDDYAKDRLTDGFNTIVDTLLTSKQDTLDNAFKGDLAWH